LQALLQKEKLQNDKDKNVKVNDKELDGLAAKGKGCQSKQAGGGKVKNQHGAEETIARVLKANGVVL